MTGTARRSAILRVVVVVTWIAAAVFVTGIAAAVVVLLLGRLPTRDERDVFALSMLVAAGAAIAYAPVRHRLGRIVAGLSGSNRATPADLIRGFSGRLSRAVPLDELLLQLVETLRTELTLRSAEVWIGSGGRLERTVSLPDLPRTSITLTAKQQSVIAHAGVSGAEWARVWVSALAPADEEPFRVAPVTNAGELLGLIVVRGAPGRRAFDPEEEWALVEIARQVGLALHNVRLDSELQASLEELRSQALALQASRGRLVAAADNERKRLERDLHDGAQQHLVALAVNLQMARTTLENDPKKAAALLDDLATGIQATMQELRALAQGIYPPLLADRGLVDALAAAARRASFPAKVTAKQQRRYPPEIESAVYFCCLEALQNTAKHAGSDRKAVVRVWEEAGALRFEVSDDGAGFEVDEARRGAGFANMNDRLGAIGGSLRVESAPGKGTAVSGTIPIAAAKEIVSPKGKAGRP